MCGFCNYTPPNHAHDCPWVAFRDGYLVVWPEEVANLNDDDQNDRLAQVAGEREV